MQTEGTQGMRNGKVKVTPCCVRPSSCCCVVSEEEEVGVEVTCSSFSSLPSDLGLASLHSQLLKPAAIKSS